MAEQEAGQPVAQTIIAEDPLGEDKKDGEQQKRDQQEEQQKQAARTYSQEEMDRILNKVRKNARYLGRKEAEAEFGRRQQPQQQVEDKPAEAPKSPKREDFEDYETFLVEKAKFEARQASAEDRAKWEKDQREKAAKEARQKSERSFKQRADAYFKENPDAARDIEEATDVMISDPMGEAIQESELGPQILHYLTQNPEEADRISGLPSAAAQARAIGRIEASIEAKGKKTPEPANKDEGGDKDNKDGEEAQGQDAAEKERNPDGTFKSPPKSRKAPEPIEPGSGRPASASRDPSDKDDIDTWMEKANAADRRRAAGI